MATKTVVEFIDDLDGSTEDVKTVTLAVAGTDYEIDLSPTNRDKLDQALAPFLSAARKTSRGARASAATSTASRSSSGASSRGYDIKAVRAWAAAHNIAVPPRGRIPNRVLEQYRAAGH
jgi:hypothetical protein